MPERVLCGWSCATNLPRKEIGKKMSKSVDNCPGAVSYTHLDVYKRQALHGSKAAKAKAETAQSQPTQKEGPHQQTGCLLYTSNKNKGAAAQNVQQPFACFYCFASCLSSHAAMSAKTSCLLVSTCLLYTSRSLPEPTPGSETSNVSLCLTLLVVTE